MPQSLFGSNVDLPYVRDMGRFLDYHKALDPALMVAIVDKPEQWDKIPPFAAEFPNATIIARVWHEQDGGFHLPPEAAGDTRAEIASAEGYVETFQALGRGNMILSLLNEPTAYNGAEAQKKLVAWCIRAIEYAAFHNVRVCLPNWADRHPQVVTGQWVDLYDTLLEKAAIHPEIVSIGMHLYGPDGFIDTLAGLVNRCSEIGIRCPDVYISEFGLDTAFHGDVMDGYRNRMAGDAYARWHAEQLDGALRPFVEAGIVKGVATFGYGHTVRWFNYDVEPDRSFQDTMIALQKEGKLSIAVKALPQSVSKPANAGSGRKVICRKFRNIRSGPSTRHHDDGDLPIGAVATVYDTAPVAEKLADGSIVNWWWMESEQGNGWIQSTGWAFENVPTTAELKPLPDVLPPPAQETITDVAQLPPVPSVTLKTWAFGFEMVGTEEQKTAIERGLELMVAGMAWIGQAAGTSVTIKAREVTT